MDFCSIYAYDYGFDGSDEEDCEINDESKTIKTKIRKGDTNIIAFRFNELVTTNEMFAGDPKTCKCGAFMSFLSAQNVTKIDEKFTWKCEYCEQMNDMSAVLDDINELPKDDDVTFLIEASKSKTVNPATPGLSESNNATSLVFCIDVSGSMDTRVPIKTDDNANRAYANKNITRLHSVKCACMETLNKLKNEEPQKKVSLVTFSEDVKYFGDCAKIRNNEPLIKLHGEDVLKNKELIQSKAHNTSDDVKSIAESSVKIEQYLKHLRTEGATALGPALLFSIVAASKKPGSSVILCTDGCANVGLGRIEGSNTGEGEKYYDEITEFAKEQGVVVNVLSMEGTDCKLNMLGRVAAGSNGLLNIVNPLNLSEEFKSIVESRLVATNVQAKLIVNHKYLYIRDEKLEEEEAKALEKNDQQAKLEIEKKRESILVRDIGNADIDTEITFEYGIRKIENKEERPQALTELPFQLQITYTTIDGSKAVRVYTKMQKFTRNREEAERNVRSKDLIFVHSAQTTSTHLLKNSVVASRFKTQQIDRMYERNRWARTDTEECHFKTLNSFELSSTMSLRPDTASNALYRSYRTSRAKLMKEKIKRTTLAKRAHNDDSDDDNIEAKNTKTEEKETSAPNTCLAIFSPSTSYAFNVSHLVTDDNKNNDEKNDTDDKKEEKKDEKEDEKN